MAGLPRGLGLTVLCVLLRGLIGASAATLRVRSPVAANATTRSAGNSTANASRGLNAMAGGAAHLAANANASGVVNAALLKSIKEKESKQHCGSNIIQVSARSKAFLESSGGTYIDYLCECLNAQLVVPHWLEHSSDLSVEVTRPRSATISPAQSAKAQLCQAMCHIRPQSSEGSCSHWIQKEDMIEMCSDSLGPYASTCVTSFVSILNSTRPVTH